MKTTAPWWKTARGQEEACLVDIDGTRFRVFVPTGGPPMVTVGARRYHLEFGGTMATYPTYFEEGY